MSVKLKAVGDEPKSKTDKIVVPIIVVFSFLVPLAVAALILFPDTFKIEMDINRSTLPAFHAILNGITALLLILALVFVRLRNFTAHRNTMLVAFSFSAIFLVSYVISKLGADSMPYGGEGWIRGVYFFVLISHILLSIPVLPLAMFAIYRGLNNQNQRHKKVVRWAFPIWLYVTITGVLVYLFMAPYY